jgi:ADP-ribose pyrophosphatase
MSTDRSIKTEQQLLVTRGFSVDEIGYTHLSGKEIRRAVVRHPGAVIVLPLTAHGEIVFVRQFRWSVQTVLLELPAGTCEIGEEPLVTAQREIQEEIGFAASKWESLGTLFPAPGFCDEKQFVYLAQDLSHSKYEGDEDEEIEVVTLSMSEIRGLIKAGDIKDGKTLATISLAVARGILPVEAIAG